MKFQVGDRAIKVGGNFQHTGTIVMAGHTTAGAERYVIEFDPPVGGMLHVYTPDQLAPLPVVGEAA